MLINVYSTVKEPAPLAFPHILNDRRDLSDPELSEHLEGFVGYVLSRGDQKMTHIRYHVMRHIQRVRHQFSITVEDEYLDDFSTWAWESNSIVFLSDSTVRDPNGRILIQPDGSEPDAEAQPPYPEDAFKRRDRTNEQLQKRLVPVSEGLPPVIGLAEALPRSAEEVAGRALALFAVALRAEAISSGEDLPVAELQAKLPAAFRYLSPEETEFMHSSSPQEQHVVNFVWRYEALSLLLWALGSLDVLSFPSGICDVPLIAEKMLSVDQHVFIENAALRSTEELLDALDLHYRLHWAAVEARVNKKKTLEGLDEGVVSERHHALNWLLHFQNNNVDWDEIDTPT